MIRRHIPNPGGSGGPSRSGLLSAASVAAFAVAAAGALLVGAATTSLVAVFTHVYAAAAVAGLFMVAYGYAANVLISELQPTVDDYDRL